MFLRHIILWLLLICINCEDNHDKRILPDYVQQQMTHLQSELQTLKATVLSQTGELQTLKTTVQTQHDTIQAQTGKISSLEQTLANSDQGGAVFVRWGRTDCPANLTELVYSGYTGGSFWTHHGAAAEYVCLPRDPIWGPYKDLPNDDHTGRMYGTEYESENVASPFGQHSHNEEVPCAVCRPKSFASSVMIPARTTCYSGWTKAYGGSLGSGKYDHESATQYICVDEDAQPLDGGADTNDDGRLIYAVKAECGSLRCPPYEQNKYLSCVVCMK